MFPTVKDLGAVAQSAQFAEGVFDLLVEIGHHDGFEVRVVSLHALEKLDVLGLELRLFCCSKDRGLDQAVGDRLGRCYVLGFRSAESTEF